MDSRIIEEGKVQEFPPLPESIVITSYGWFKRSDYDFLQKHGPSWWWIALWWLESVCFFFFRVEDPWKRALRLRDEKAKEPAPADFDAEIEKALRFDPLAEIREGRGDGKII